MATLDAYDDGHTGIVMSPLLLLNKHHICLSVKYTISKGGELRVYVTNIADPYTGTMVQRKTKGKSLRTCVQIPDDWEYFGLIFEANFADSSADTLTINSVNWWYYRRPGTMHIDNDGEFLMIFCVFGDMVSFGNKHNFPYFHHFLSVTFTKQSYSWTLSSCLSEVADRVNASEQ